MTYTPPPIRDVLQSYVHKRMGDLAVERVRESQAAVLREIDNVQERTLQLKRHLEDECRTRS